jgi:hypothetical protein
MIGWGGTWTGAFAGTQDAAARRTRHTRTLTWASVLCPEARIIGIVYLTPVDVRLCLAHLLKEEPC